jgi:hypothetical protein
VLCAVCNVMPVDSVCARVCVCVCDEPYSQANNSVSGSRVVSISV